MASHKSRLLGGRPGGGEGLGGGCCRRDATGTGLLAGWSGKAIFGVAPVAEAIGVSQARCKWGKLYCTLRQRGGVVRVVAPIARRSALAASALRRSAAATSEAYWRRPRLFLPEGALRCALMAPPVALSLPCWCWHQHQQAAGRPAAPVCSLLCSVLFRVRTVATSDVL